VVYVASTRDPLGVPIALPADVAAHAADAALAEAEVSPEGVARSDERHERAFEQLGPPGASDGVIAMNGSDYLAAVAALGVAEVDFPRRAVAAFKRPPGTSICRAVASPC
jgi:hypothetical protein